MIYAQYVSETQINTTIPKKGYDEDGRLVTGDLTNRPDVLRLMNFFPVAETPMPQEPIEGYHYEKRYAPPENDAIAQTWVSVEDPPAPPEPTRVYSKLKILMAAQSADPPFVDDLIQFLESDIKTKYIWDASNTIEDNAILAQYLPTISQALGKTENEVKAFLDRYCIAD